MKMISLLSVPVALALASCVQNSLTGDGYTRGDAQMAEPVQTGRITGITPISIQGNTEAGALLGGVGGAFLGSNIGGGRAAHTAGGVGGGLLGMALGSAVEDAVETRQGIRITVKLNQGGTIAVVQQVSSREQFNVGDRVSVYTSASGRSRVSLN